MTLPDFFWSPSKKNLDCKKIISFKKNLTPPPKKKNKEHLKKKKKKKNAMKNRDGRDTKAKLFPPADPGRKYGLHSLGLINTLSIRCTRYCCKNYRVNLYLAMERSLAFYRKRLFSLQLETHREAFRYTTR